MGDAGESKGKKEDESDDKRDEDAAGKIVEATGAAGGGGGKEEEVKGEGAGYTFWKYREISVLLPLPAAPTSVTFNVVAPIIIVVVVVAVAVAVVAAAVMWGGRRAERSAG